MGLNVGVVCGHDAGDHWSSYPNSAGGVSIKGSFTYTGGKTIKYISIGFIPYNRVEDAVKCTISGSSERFLKCTGPYESGKSYAFWGENMWYNSAINSVRVTGAKIQFMDGTEETVSDSQIGTQAAAGPTAGCYVATAVYGSYDCPQVWTLRRYRDFTLAKTWYGRAFIRTYYAVSPTLVKWFGNTVWFKKIWKGELDKMVANLNAKGIKNTPYEDKSW